MKDDEKKLITANKLYRSRRFKESIPLYEALASKGFYGCARRLGWMYFLEEGVERDLSKSLRWLNMASESDDNEAKFAIGKVYLYQGKWEEAANQFTLTASEGFAPSMYRLGWIALQEGKTDQACRWLEKAASCGNLKADTDLSFIYFRKSLNPVVRLKGLYLIIRVSLKSFFVALNDPSDVRLLF